MIAGVDEAGRGPVIGPMVIAGVQAKDQNIFRQIQVKDSKKLSKKRRTFLADQIKQIAAKIEFLVIKASDIDDMRKVMTMNEIEVHTFIKIIKKLKPDQCFVDAADVNSNRFGSNISAQLPKRIEVISKHKADDIYPIVSAASIIAKTIRDKEVEKIAQKLEKKISQPLGSGYPSDPITQQFLESWVKKYKKLPPNTRKSWKTAQRIYEQHTRKTLNDF
ncbi:MAG: ribonuclease HII [Candidatus Thermoplasmatota archaeon]|nr:ribonuclease HII [Candidatus Thermoplasmatota archaeon]